MTRHINLQLGWPSPSLFPAAQIMQGAGGILQDEDKTKAALIYGPDPGYQPLRESIAQWLTESYRPTEPTTADRICVSGGASANLHNILSKFTEPGYTRRVWMIEPCYFLACPIFDDAGLQGRLRGVPEDEEGLDADFLRTSLEAVEADKTHPTAPSTKLGARYGKIYKHVIYAVPTFANPSGKTMSLRRREELVRIAREFDALVVTDDVYDILQWPAERQASGNSLSSACPPRIVDIDRTLDGGPLDEWGNSISNGSFSKIIAPGVRTGWAEATPAFALSLSAVGSSRSGGCPSHITASFIHEMMASGKFQQHIRDVLIPTYSARYYALMQAIKDKLLPLGFEVSTGKPYDEQSPVAGGYFTYLTVPRNLTLSAGELAAAAMEKQNVKFAFGDMMLVQGDDECAVRGASGFGRGIRLSWSWHTEEELLEGVQRIAQLVAEHVPSN